MPSLPREDFHDAGAVLVVDGEVVAALEEERIDRLKHSNYFPSNAIRSCLSTESLTFGDVDIVAYFFAESYVDHQLRREYLRNPKLQIRSARELLTDNCREEFGTAPPKVAFVQHHLAHAESAFAHSGYEETLVAILDGNGENESTSIFQASGKSLTPLRAYPISLSVGHLYSGAIRLLGYKRFDEYKAMGLAPYGDRRRFRELFGSLYELKSDGEYDLDLRQVHTRFLDAGFEPRRSLGPFTQDHADFAAALQDAVETIVLHILEYWQTATSMENLCVAGGVGHNATLNGRVASSGLFEKVFVHPASHDAGAAVGAALNVSKRHGRTGRKKLRHVSWGPGLDSEAMKSSLHRWRNFIQYEVTHNAVEDAASMLAQGDIIGWVHGRSEFGPRALGNRSLLADPRPLENRTRINEVIKKREDFRPFAPAVLEGSAQEYFEIPYSADTAEFMSFVVDVRPAYRNLLAAVTHTDKSARVQVVRKADNEVFWTLISAFESRTGIPVLLNTSLNSYAEPIVQGASDAIRVLMATSLETVFLENYVVRKTSDLRNNLTLLRGRLLPGTIVSEEIFTSGRSTEIRYVVRNEFRGIEHHVPYGVYAVLVKDTRPDKPGSDYELVASDLVRLWERRAIDLEPL